MHNQLKIVMGRNSKWQYEKISGTSPQKNICLMGIKISQDHHSQSLKNDKGSCSKLKIIY